MNPTEEQAYQFAIMLQAGLPPSQALLYFVEVDDPGEFTQLVHKWIRSRAVKRAMAALETKPWQEMSLDERCRAALDQHYSQLAYLLRSHHYAEVGQTDKAKLDTARQALEAKLAGMAGKGDALSEFFSDLKAGKIKLTSPVPVLN